MVQIANPPNGITLWCSGWSHSGEQQDEWPWRAPGGKMEGVRFQHRKLCCVWSIERRGESETPHICHWNIADLKNDDNHCRGRGLTEGSHGHGQSDCVAGWQEQLLFLLLYENFMSADYTNDELTGTTTSSQQQTSLAIAGFQPIEGSHCVYLLQKCIKIENSNTSFNNTEIKVVWEVNLLLNKDLLLFQSY